MYNFKKTVKDIERLSKILQESYVFDDEDMEIDETPYADEEDMVEDEPTQNTPKGDDKINQIRSIALSGIQEFAEHVDSDEYQIFKNIWMSCDKFYSNKNKEEKF
jgi:hypothetical protein